MRFFAAGVPVKMAEERFRLSYGMGSTAADVFGKAIFFVDVQSPNSTAIHCDYRIHGMKLTIFFIVALLCSQVAKAASPNIVFVLADDMRPDVMGILGHSIVQTPNLDSLAREGVIFTRAVVGYPICVVSRAELFTGCCAFKTGVQYAGRCLAPQLALWPDTLRRNGYRTWFSGKWHNDGHPHTRGFETTDGLFSGGGDKTRGPIADHAGRQATGYVGWTFKFDDGVVDTDKGVGLTPDTDRFITDGAIRLIERKPSEPFFLQVSLTGPHDPRIEPRGYEQRYASAKIPLPTSFVAEHPFDHGNAGGRDENLLRTPREPDEVRAELAVYYAVISNIDEQIGRIVSALHRTGAWENTILIFSSDHGLALGSHGLIGKQNMYEHTVGVPLIMHGPGIPKGQRITAQCYLRDLFPTTCDWADIEIPATVQSRSLAPLLSGKFASIYDEVYSCFTDTQRMIRDQQWKLVWYPKLKRYQLFDVVSDPNELHDRSQDTLQAPRMEAMRQKLEAWLRQNGDPVFDVP
jgi:arylsulfatase A-like enzyme